MILSLIHILSTLDMIRLAFLAADVDLETLESATLDGDFMLLNDISYWQIDEAALQETVRRISEVGSDAWE